MLARWRPSKVQFHLSKRNWYWHSRALMVMASLRVSATPGSRLHILRCFFSSLSRSHSLKWALPMLSSGKEFSGRTDNGSLPVNLEENITSHLETERYWDCLDKVFRQNNRILTKLYCIHSTGSTAAHIMLKSLVNVQMNSAVQWLMFRGIQHLLEIEINSRWRCVWVKSKFSAVVEKSGLPCNSFEFWIPKNPVVEQWSYN